jgi:hypothetical protein
MFLLSTYAHLIDNEQAIPFVSHLKRPFCIRRIRCISRRALGDPSESPLMKLYQSVCLQSMIMYTGFDLQAFSDLLQLFEPKFNQLLPYSVNGGMRHITGVRGKRRKITAVQCLGLLLAWMQTRGK